MRIDEDTQRLLKTVLDHFDEEDKSARERQIRVWRQLKLFWEGFHNTWYSEVAHDWRIYDDTQSEDNDQASYDKPINVFRAYLESIIAALSIVIPPVKCFPDDADNTLDLSTARAGDKIAELIYRHNDVSLLWLHALFVFCTEGMTACYSYPKSDKSYGTYEDKKHEESTEEHEIATCPQCGYTISDRTISTDPKVVDSIENYEDKFMPDDGDIDIEDAINQDLCPACIAIIVPQITKESVIVTRLVGVTNEPKTRICLEVYGGLNVKVPNYARKQEDCPYLIYSYETHYSNAIERYAHLHGKDSLTAKKIAESSGPKDAYEGWSRVSPQYQGDYPDDIVTIRNAWLRPCAFNVLPDENDVKKLKKKFPNGVKAVFVNDDFGEASNEALDDCWTLSYNPLSDNIHHDPLGLLLVSIQEITNDLVSLTLQTIEHGIPQTFADPGVLDFDAYRQMESVPGGIYEAKPKSGQSIQQSFHEVKTASLSPEVMPFANNIQSLAQLVSGALPSLFGGAMQGQGETASQYSMSRAQAQQRLQNTWKVFTVWWKQIFGKVIPMFIQETQHQGDERDVRHSKDGGFFNVFIRRAELEGKIGKVELEANENLPLTWSQKKDIIEKLLLSANPEVLAVLGASENLPIIREAIGLTDFYVPGEDDREEQYDEIKLLLNSEPIPTMNPEFPEMPSVDVDQMYNNHQIHFETVRKWATSEAGRQARVDNPAGYKNVLLHGKIHFMMLQGEMMPQPGESEGEGAAPSEKPNPLNQQAPIVEEQNVQTTA